jgi:Ca-activated chloride channel family protein
MTDDDFARLKDAPPPAREEAKRAALAAALAAFDMEAEKTATPTQGEAKLARQKNASPRKEGGRPMRSTPHFNRALAASLAASVIAAPVYWLYAQRQPALPPRYAEMRIAQEEALRAPPPPASVARPESPPPAAPLAATEAPASPMPAPEPLVGGLARGAAGGRQAEYHALARRPHFAKTTSNLPRDQERPSRVAAVSAETPAAPRQAPSGAAGLADRLGAQETAAGRMRKESRDKFAEKEASPVKSVAAEPVSTFSLAVDTASYAFARRMVMAGQLPAKDSVRAEEFINYFPYSYPKPETAETPFKPTVTIAPSPWNAHNKLVHVAIQGYTLQSAHRPRANLVLLIDVSGSMMPEDRLPLVKNAFRLLVDELQPDDTVGIVTYADGSGVALEPTKVSEKGKIFAAIAGLGAGGSTAGAQGIQDAYRLAEAHFDKDGVNRIILATDGDFNVGVTDPRELQGFIERKRKSGVFLSILGVGQDNYNDALMQKLARYGNGVAAYVDTLNEARKVLVEQASSTLFPIAKDVKIQMEWNPARVSEYRLIGYETRNLRREDFNNDNVAAGNVGSGLTVTAIYEVTPVGAEKKLVDDLRYGKAGEPRRDGDAAEWGFLKLRYKLPKEETSRLISLPIVDAMAKRSLSEAAEDVRFSIAAAAYAQLLEGAPYLGGFGYDDVAALAQGAKGEDHFGYRAEFVNLVRLAKSAQP